MYQVVYSNRWCIRNHKQLKERFNFPVSGRRLHKNYWFAYAEWLEVKDMNFNEGIKHLRAYWVKQKVSR